MPVSRRALLLGGAFALVACQPAARVQLSERPPRVESPKSEAPSPAAPPPAPTAERAPLRTAAPAPTQVVAPTPRRPDAPTRVRPDDGSLQRALDSFMKEQRGSFGVAVRDLTGPVVAGYGQNDRFPLASLYKLLLMSEVMRQVKAGQVKLDDTIKTVATYSFGEPEGGVPPDTRVSVDEALGVMIGVSSNAAALALIDLVGAKALEGVPARLGLRETAIDVEATGAPGHYVVDARGSARDLIDVLGRIDARRLIDPELDRRMIELMLGQQIDDRLPLLLPPNVPIAHKTADLEGFTHDAGLVYAGSRPFAIAVLAHGESLADGKAVVAEVARMVYGYFSANA